MLAPGRPQLSPITAADLAAVGGFLHEHLNPRVSAAAWADSLRVPWRVDGPNHGFQLRLGGRIVGVYLAFYSERDLAGVTERFCNLGAWCVLESHRADGLRLLRALLAQRGYTFTDFSPSGNVIGLNERLRFTHLDTTTALVPALPWPALGSARVSSDPAVMEDTLRGRELEIYRDHAATAAAIHVVIRRSGRSCYVVLRRDRRKRIAGFASVLHVSDPQLFREAVRPLAAHLLRRHRIHSLLAEARVVGGRPPRSLSLGRARPRMFRSDRLTADQIDYLYSELTCVAW